MNSKEEILTWLEEVSPERKRYLKEFNNSLENSKDSSKWAKALTNLKKNGITGKIVGNKIILKKNGKTYETDKMFHNFPEDLAGNKLDIITVFFNRNRGGVGPKHSEDFTTKTNLKLLGKTLKEDVLDEASLGSDMNYSYIVPDSKLSSFNGINKLNKRGIKLQNVRYNNGKIYFEFRTEAPKLMSYLASNTGDYNFRGSFKEFPESISAVKQFMDSYIDPREDEEVRYMSDASKWGKVFSYNHGKNYDWEFKGIPNKWELKINKMLKPFLNDASKAVIIEMLKDKKYRTYLMNIRSKMENIKSNGETIYDIYGDVKVPPFTSKDRKQHRNTSFSVNTNISEDTNYFPY